MNIRYIDQDSKQDIAYKFINDKIASGEYPPGMVLVERQIAEDLAMSRTPVRAALQRLAAENELVEAVPHLGVAVKTLTAVDAEEIFELRAVIETAAMRSFIAHYDAQAVNQLCAYVSDMERAFMEGDMDMTSILDVKFHQFLLDHCNNRRLDKVFRILIPTSQRLRSILFAQKADWNFMSDTVKWHREYANFILQKDVPAAQAHLERHYAAIVGELKKYLPQKQT